MRLLGSIGERSTRMIAGAIVLILLSSLTVFGVRVANGALRPRYQVLASFESAGQGLIEKSDVKIRGVNIGSVKSVKLRDGRALVRMDVDDDERVPVSSTATIRPKTLFGEKFVDIDPGADEARGPFLADEQEIAQTTGGFELEKVLSEAYPIVQAIDPDELATILKELSAAGNDLGPTVNRTIVNFRKVAEQQAGRTAELGQFLDDLALLSETLDTTSPVLVDTARDLNVALPELNARAPQLSTALDQAARLSADLADLLEANQPFLDKSITQGGKTIQLLYEERGQLPGLVRGLRYFFEVLGSVGRIDLGDGTRLAAVKGILGGGPMCGRTVMGCPLYTDPPAGRTPGPASRGPRAPLTAEPGDAGTDDAAGTILDPLPAPTSGTPGIISLVEGLLR